MTKVPYSKKEFRKAEIPWLCLGLKSITEEGSRNFRIDTLSKEIGISRTSFYHLFQTKSNYFTRLCEYWAYTGTYKYFEHLASIKEPKNKLIELLRIIYKDRLEGMAWISFKHIGEDNPAVNEIIEKIEKSRMQFVSDILVNIGYSHDIAEVKARVLMYFYFGWMVLHWQDNDKIEISKKEILDLISSIEIDLNYGLS